MVQEDIGGTEHEASWGERGDVAMEEGELLLRRRRGEEAYYAKLREANIDHGASGTGNTTPDSHMTRKKRRHDSTPRLQLITSPMTRPFGDQTLPVALITLEHSSQSPLLLE